MKSPQEYVEFMDQFLETDVHAVKITGTNKEDIACLTMVAYLKKLPVEVLSRKGVAVLRRNDK